MKRFYIIRGLPGSGKTTVARMIADGAIRSGRSAVVVDADQHALDRHGYYRPARDNQTEATATQRRLSLSQVHQAISRGVEIIVLTHTAVTAEHAAPYAIAAVEAHYTIQTASLGRVFRSSHRIPSGPLGRSLSRWQPDATFTAELMRRAHNGGNAHGTDTPA